MKSSAFLYIFLPLLVACSVAKPEGGQFGDSVGCGNFQVFLVSDDGRAYVRLALKASEFGLQRENIFDLDLDQSMDVQFFEYDASVRHLLCNDVRGSKPEVLQTSVAAKGRIVVRMTEENLKLYSQSQSYRVDIELDGILFENGKRIDHSEYQVIVGWLPG